MKVCELDDLIPIKMRGNLDALLPYEEIPESGTRFGLLTVLGRDPTEHKYWICRCDCGKFHRAIKYDIQRGFTKSCGCMFRLCCSERRFKDHTGERFGRLTVTSLAGRENSKIYWTCKCDCGNIVTEYAGDLVSGDIKSCGCWKSDLTTTRNWRHGISDVRLYSVWGSMKDRCLNPNCLGYSYYGGRGIEVCDKWRDDFKAFYDWAMDNGYQEGLTIDRIDNDGNYCPENCRWVTALENSHNSRACKNVTYNGETKCCREWDRTMGLYRGTVSRRLREGHTVEDAINTPQKHKVKQQ